VLRSLFQFDFAMTSDTSSSDGDDDDEVVIVRVDESKVKTVLDEEASSSSYSSDAGILQTGHPSALRPIECCAGNYCMMGHDHTLDTTRVCVRCKGRFHELCLSRYQDTAMNLTVCMKCGQEKGGKLTPKQAPNVVTPSSPTDSDEPTSASPARKKVKTTKNRSQPKSKKKGEQPTQTRLRDLLATSVGQSIFVAMYKQAKASEMGLRALVRPNKNGFFSSNVSKWYGTMGLLDGYEELTARTLNEKFSKAMNAAQNECKLTHATDEAGTQSEVWPTHLKIAYEFMQYQDQLKEEKVTLFEKRAEVKTRQTRVLGGPRRPLGRPGQRERDTADPTRNNKAYSRDVTTKDSANLQFDEQTIASVVPLNTKSRNNTAADRKPYTPNFRRKYKPFQGLDYSNILAQQELLTASFHSLSSSFMSRSTTDIVNDMENLFAKMKIHREKLNDLGEDSNHHSRMIGVCETAIDTLEKEMDSLASGQLRMTGISESLTRMYDESSAIFDDDDEEEFIDH
jgi:hypothetical protein